MTAWPADAPPLTLLFAPGDDPRKIAKALASGAEAVILDLEDSVREANRPAARENVLKVLRETQDNRGRPWRVVRINACGTRAQLEDLAAVVAGAPDAVMLPKPHPEQMAGLDAALSVMEVREGVAPGSIGVLPIVSETARGTLALAAGEWRPHPRLAGFVWGAEDLAADVGALNNRLDGGQGDYFGPYALVGSLCLLAATAVGVPAFDAVYTRLGDPDGLEREAWTGMQMGYRGKAAIHPEQLEPIRRAYAPTPQDMAWAQGVVAAFEAGGAGAGAIRYGGRMLDAPHLALARRMIARQVR